MEDLGYVRVSTMSSSTNYSQVIQYIDIGPGPNKHTWGCVLLSKVYSSLSTIPHIDTFCAQFPILKSQHHLLPSPDGELAPAIEAVVDIYGVNVTVIVAHNGQGS